METDWSLALVLIAEVLVCVCVLISLTLGLIAGVQHGRQAYPQPIVRLHGQLSDVLQPDGGALSRGKTAHVQLEHI